MYGLLLESLACFIKEKYGEEKWEEIRRAAGVEQTSFSTHQVYPENLIPRLSAKAIEMLNVTENEFMSMMGESFVDFVGQYGYDRVLSVLGRHMRDFLNGLDNLHEYLKFSYPRMRAPSFFCEDESASGLTLHYRSKRRGFVYYTMGQIKQVGKLIYNKDVDIEVVKEETIFDMHVVTFNLKFDNRAFSALTALDREDQRLPLRASIFIEIFPFCILFGSDMVIKHIGNSLSQIVPEMLGQDISAFFDLTRPLVDFRFESILKRTNNIFELVSHKAMGSGPHGEEDEEENAQHPSRKLHLKGQMLYMEEWEMIVFLGTPQMNDLDAMIRVGLYINDLSMHDFSRDLMMAGTQQSVELKLALDQEQQKSKKLEESMKKLDEEMKRTDELLYQMIPKLVADRLRKGENPVDTCQVFECVTILFSDVVTFTEICSRISPMEVVSMLNAMYSIFDRLTELNGVYKVETIGDAYMAVGGAPVKDELHAARTCNMALDMIDAIQDLTDPSTGQHLRIRVGVHSGAVVAGVVGLKMPRYCLFGDTVNTASRMESTSEPMKIHISETTRSLLGEEYMITDRGEIVVKGKGHMKTYWLNGKEGRCPMDRTGRLSVASSPTGLSPAPSGSTRGYSPVTLEVVAKKTHTSGNSTPVHSPIHRLHSNPGPGSTKELLDHHRSVAEMEKDFQRLMDSPLLKAPKGNQHLSVSSTDGKCPSSSEVPTDQTVQHSLCPHGKRVAPAIGATSRNGNEPKTSINSKISWIFPPTARVGCALTDADNDAAGGNNGVSAKLSTETNDEPLNNVGSSITHLASGEVATNAGLEGDFCCPSFIGVRPSKRVEGTVDKNSVACSFL